MAFIHFYKSQETLTVVGWILRSVVSFGFLLLVAKMMGQRSISQLRFLDFIIALTLGNIIAHPLSDERLGLSGSMITTLTFVLLYVAATWLSLKWPVFKHYLDPSPITLIHKGKILHPNVAKAKISIEYLFAELRKAKIADYEKVALAVWEPGGEVSIFLNPADQPLTPSVVGLTVEPLNLIKPIIIDGNVNKTLLKEMGKDRLWLQQKLALTGVHIRDIKLAIIDGNDKIKIEALSSN